MSQTPVASAPPDTPDAEDAEEAERPIAPRWPGAVPSVPPTSVVGRDRDLAALRKLLRDPAPAFITMVGVGGVGKSRLAAELAASDVIACRGRVASVPLDAVSDASMVLPAIAGALGIGDEPGASVAQSLSDALGGAPTLLVLDTMEHVRGAAPALADLHDRTPGLTILATSRVALGVPREKVMWIEPLAVPAETASDEAAMEALLASPGGAAVPRPGALGPPGVRGHAGERGAGRRDLPPPRRPAAGHRARRGGAPRPAAAPAPRPAGRPDGRARPRDLVVRRRRPRAAAQPAHGDGLEHRAAGRAGPAAVPAARRDRRGVRALDRGLDPGARRAPGPGAARDRRERRAGPPGGGVAPADPRRPRLRDAHHRPRRRARAPAGRRRARRDALGPRLRGPRDGRGLGGPAADRARGRGARPAGRGPRRHPRGPRLGDGAGRRRLRRPDDRARWPSSGGPAATTRRAGCGSPRPSRWRPTPRPRTCARRWAARGSSPRTRATTRSRRPTSARRWRRRARTATRRPRRSSSTGWAPTPTVAATSMPRRATSRRASCCGAGSGTRPASRARSTRSAASTTSGASWTGRGRCSSRASRSSRPSATRTRWRSP